MLEISILSVIFLAISYWAVLWVMGRREDVLHGEFVEAKVAGKEARRSAFADKRTLPDKPAPSKPELKVRPIFPEPPAAPAVAKPAEASKPVESPKPVEASTPAEVSKPVEIPKPAPVARQSIIPEQPVRRAVAEPQAFRPERLESLLNSIKQDLNQLVQK